jgi:uncharacterized damage-inducible protein DinB
MKEIFLTYAKYNKESDKAVVSILARCSIEDLEKDRGSYYGSLSGLARHLLEGTLYFQGLLKTALSHNAAAVKVLAPLEGITVPKGKLTEDQWKGVVAAFETVDEVFIRLVSSLADTDFTVPVAVPWYGGKPDTIPLSFLLQNVVVHGTHHRGQISQVLDELKIDNDYSAIKVELLAN